MGMLLLGGIMVCSYFFFIYPFSLSDDSFGGSW